MFKFVNLQLVLKLAQNEYNSRVICLAVKLKLTAIIKLTMNTTTKMSNLWLIRYDGIVLIYCT